MAPASKPISGHHFPVLCRITVTLLLLSMVFCVNGLSQIMDADIPTDCDAQVRQAIERSNKAIATSQQKHDALDEDDNLHQQNVIAGHIRAVVKAQNKLVNLYCDPKVDKANQRKHMIDKLDKAVKTRQKRMDPSWVRFWQPMWDKARGYPSVSLGLALGGLGIAGFSSGFALGAFILFPRKQESTIEPPIRNVSNVTVTSTTAPRTTARWIIGLLVVVVLIVGVGFVYFCGVQSSETGEDEDEDNKTTSGKAKAIKNDPSKIGVKPSKGKAVKGTSTGSTTSTLVPSRK